MGIAEDLESFKEHWAKIAWPGRAIYVVSILLSVLSVASLSDSVFRFKGFIIEAIQFWEAFTTPIIDLAQNIGISIEAWQFNYYVVAMLVYVPFFTERWRVLPLRNKAQNVANGFSALAIPYIFPFTFAIIMVAAQYVLLLAIALYPPVSPPFMKIALRMVMPVLLVAVVAAISEGISRPLV